MTGTVYDKSGKAWNLPVLTGWEVTHGLGIPCDNFSVTFHYAPEMLPILKEACRFRAFQEGTMVFNGVVDGYTITCDVRGSTAVLEGRSLAALLMDNEAESGEYFSLGLEEVLRRHVTAWGVTDIRRIQAPAVSHFTVRSGQSQWSVLREYLQFAGGLEPRFDRTGTLLLDGTSGGGDFTVGGSTAVSDMELRDDRYGVITEVLVKKTRSGTVSTVTNDSLIARGGSARRVVNVPRYTDYDAVRYTGEYQIRQSLADSVIYTMTLPVVFAAFAGDTVWLNHSPIGLTGKFRVSQSRCWAEKGQFGTELTLAVWEAW